MKFFLNMFFLSVLFVTINAFSTNDQSANISTFILKEVDEVVNLFLLSDTNRSDFKEIMKNFLASDKSDEVRLDALKKLAKIIKSEKEYYMDTWLKLIVFCGLMRHVSNVFSESLNGDYTLWENIFGASNFKVLIKIGALGGTMTTLYYITKYYVRSKRNTGLETVEKIFDQEIEALEQKIALAK